MYLPLKNNELSSKIIGIMINNSECVKLFL